MEKENSNQEQEEKYRLHYFQRKDIKELSADELEEESHIIYTNLMRENARPANGRILWIRYASVAALLVMVMSMFFYRSYQTDLIPSATQISNTLVDNDAEPGKHAATLFLSNGKSISLDEVAAGLVAEQPGVTIKKSDDQTLVYQNNNGDSGADHYNTISTSRGQEYAIILPDGSKIWLNAASSLKYPTSFTAMPHRMVELKGEAYFEIAKDSKHPFIVKTPTQEIKVLGTHFNVNSYNDEQSVKTTLVEGSVHVKGAGNVVLKPGEQAVSTRATITVKKVNVAENIAWKNGDFLFEKESLTSVLRQVSRWYNVEIVDQTGQQDMYLTGSVSRNKKLSTVLTALATISNLKFAIKDQQVIVTE